MAPIQPQPDNRSEADLELLSAYLDNQLTAAERVMLDRRLAADPALRAELEELRATTALLRQLEPVAPPRSFTLDPATVRPRRSLWAGWLPRLGGVAATLVLLITIGVTLLGQSARTTQVAVAPAPLASEKEPPATAGAADMVARQDEIESAPTAGAAALESAPAPTVVNQYSDRPTAAAAEAAPPTEAGAAMESAPAGTAPPQEGLGGSDPVEATTSSGGDASPEAPPPPADQSAPASPQPTLLPPAAAPGVAQATPGPIAEPAATTAPGVLAPGGNGASRYAEGAGGASGAAAGAALGLRLGAGGP